LLKIIQLSAWAERRQLGFKPKAISFFIHLQFIRHLHAENENFQLLGEGGIRFFTTIQLWRAQEILFPPIATQKLGCGLTYTGQSGLLPGDGGLFQDAA